jgi:hypothetical protein
MHKTPADRHQRIARIDKYVTIVAFLWLATSVVLFFLAAPTRLHAAQHPPAAIKSALNISAAPHHAARALRMYSSLHLSEQR